MSVAETVHASAVLIGDDGVLIRGRAGSGKSSLVLGLVDRDPDATRLVADDRVALAVDGGVLVASVPEAIAGKLEVRGQGIVSVDYRSPAAIHLIVDLMPPADCPRLPEPHDMQVEIMGVTLPRLMLPIGAAEAAARVRLAVRRLASATAA
jgi:serine kinase of HPr protein (carbohydrate metabolism regulator)